MTRALERALARFRRRPGPPDEGAARVSAAEFRAATHERLRALEREVGEVKRRLNGLLFAVAGAVLAQIALRLVG